MSAVPASIVVAPVIARVPLSVIALSVLSKLAVPLIVDAANSIAAFSTTDTFAPVNANAPKVEAASVKVMSAVPASIVVAPVIARVPLSVIALSVLSKLAVPLIVDAANSIAAFSTTDTFAPVNANAPKVEAASVKVILPLPASIVVAPVMARVPLSVTSPPAVTLKLAAVSA